MADADPQRQIFAISNEKVPLTTSEMLQKLARECQISPLTIVKNFFGLAYGPGKISFSDFVKYRLFDDGFIKPIDRPAIMGQRYNRDLVASVNYRHDWFSLITNKISSKSYLSAYGIPTIPTRAIYAPGLTFDRKDILRSRADLECFLLDPASYPFFGKPIEGFQSLGAIALVQCLPDIRQAVSTSGQMIAISELVDTITKTYSDGYLFEELRFAPKSVETYLGRDLSTVRVVTIQTADGPQIFRAAWKIPACGNFADNYWRAGNLLAGLDLDDGTVLRLTSGTGFDLTEVSNHPQTGLPIIGTKVPNWQSIREVALEGARLLKHFAIIGWDIAPVDEGAIVVEANETPDLSLVQLADRRGVLGTELQTLIATQKTSHKRFLEKTKADIRKL